MSKDLPGYFVFKAVCSNCNKSVLVSFSYQRSTYLPEFTLYEMDKRDYKDRELEIHTCCGKGKDCDCLK